MKEKLFELFYELSKKPYQKFFKKIRHGPSVLRSLKPHFQFVNSYTYEHSY